MGLIVDITTRCNMECAHCMWSRTTDGQDMSEEIFRAALNMNPVRGYGTLSLGTGEPTVHPRFWDFVNIALEDKRWSVRVVTNGKKTSTALKLAEMAKDGILEAHLSLDQWHDPIKDEVINAFKRDPQNHLDKRAYRYCEEQDLKFAGRCDFAKDKRPACRCPVPKVRPGGDVYYCGCETAIQIGHVLTGCDNDVKKRVRQLGCSRYLPDANPDADRRFFVHIGKVLRKGTDR